MGELVILIHQITNSPIHQLSGLNWEAMSSSNAVFNGRRRVPPPVNETIKSYAPGSPERASLKARLTSMAAETAEMPLIIGGKEIRTGDTATSVMPHDHQHVLGTWHKATEKHVV